MEVFKYLNEKPLPDFLDKELAFLEELKERAAYDEIYILKVLADDSIHAKLINTDYYITIFSEYNNIGYGMELTDNDVEEMKKEGYIYMSFKLDTNNGDNYIIEKNEEPFEYKEIPIPDELDADSEVFNGKCYVSIHLFSLYYFYAQIALEEAIDKVIFIKNDIRNLKNNKKVLKNNQYIRLKQLVKELSAEIN